MRPPLLLLLIATAGVSGRSFLEGNFMEGELQDADDRSTEQAHVVKSISTNAKAKQQKAGRFPVPNSMPLDASIANLTTLYDGRKCDLLPLDNGHNTWDSSHKRMQRSHTSKKSICGPKILIIGAMKCGTNTIGHLLAKHPRVALNRCEPKGRVRGNYGQCNSDNFQGTVAPQLSFWEGNDLSFKRTKQPDQWLDVLARRLPWTDGVNNITIDKSPSYFNTLKDSETPTLAKSLFPNAKVVATLCNPATRMYSEYEFRMVPKRLHKLKKQFVQYGYEMPKNFVQFTKTILECQRQVEEATEIEDADMEDGELSEEFCDHILRSYLSIGQYAIHINRWIQEFDDDVLVVDMEMDSVEKVRALLSHIGEDVLPPEEYPWHELQDDESSEFYTNSAYAGRNSAFQDFPNLMKRLQAHYAPYNKVLSEMIGEDFPLTW